MHAIRLRGPWERRDAAVGNWIRVRVPEEQLNTEAAVDDATETEVTYRRHFNLPSGLGPRTRVFLEIARQAGKVVEVRVNQITLTSEFSSNADSDATEATRYSVGDMLSAHNLVEIELVSENSGPPALSGDVRLLIVEP